MRFKVRNYKRLENRDAIEVCVKSTTVDVEGLIHIKDREDGVYFNGKYCYVPRLCQIMDETECDGITLEVVDGKSFYFTLDESGVHSWTTGNPDSIRHSVKRDCNSYDKAEFTLTVDNLFDSGSRANGTYFGDGQTRVYLNGKGSLTWSDIFLEGNKVKKISWRWHYCATMDKYVKFLSEVRFVNAKVEKANIINEPRWITYNPALINISACDFIKEEKEMKKENNAQAVWNSMSKAQQELCCDLIGNAAKGRISEEIKMAVFNTKISRYSGKVRGEDIRDIIFNGPATIILWRDGTKTVVKQQKGDKWDPEKAVALAVMKKTFGTNATGSDYLEYVKPYIQKAYEDEKKRKVAARRKNNAKKKAETES